MSSPPSPSSGVVVKVGLDALLVFGLGLFDALPQIALCLFVAMWILYDTLTSFVGVFFFLSADQRFVCRDE